ncbi:MAG: hypothetical protein RIR33_1332 [Pseudomonadota bacterium]|jgi:hypothetical protein
MPESAKPRRLIFVSHATPQDNAFASWLAMQLAIAGYETWRDVTKLLGGEQFWRDIEAAINDHAFRFLFISTLESNRKEGTLRELKIAKAAQTRHAIKDFIVPIKADALPFNAVHADISDLNFVRFDNGWDEGLRQLLDLLQRESAPKSDRAGPACVSEWHKRQQDRTRKSFVCRRNR